MKDNMQEIRVGFDPAQKDGDHAALSMWLPLSTILTIAGDEDIIRQIAARLDGLVLEWNEADATK